MQDPVSISERCEYNSSIYYKVIVEDHNKEVLLSTVVSCCIGLCQLIINSSASVHFDITPIAVNVVGQSSNATYEVSVGKLHWDSQYIHRILQLCGLVMAIYTQWF